MQNRAGEALSPFGIAVKNKCCREIRIPGNIGYASAGIFQESGGMADADQIFKRRFPEQFPEEACPDGIGGHPFAHDPVAGDALSIVLFNELNLFIFSKRWKGVLYD